MNNAELYNAILEEEKLGNVIGKRNTQLAIFCYSAKCVHDNAWNEVNLQARGIIFENETGKLVAKPWSKFFNLNEKPETEIDKLPDCGYTVEEKLDGSLGIIYFYDGLWRIATKGSFSSEQAVVGSGLLYDRYNVSDVNTSNTILVEIVYPNNRNVVNYYKRNELVFLSAINIDTSKELPVKDREEFSKNIGMPCCKTYDYENINNLPFRENEEGYVIRFDNGFRVKVKSPEYMRLHRILNYKSPIRILELLYGGDYDEIMSELPTHIQCEVDDIVASVKTIVNNVDKRGHELYETVAHIDDRKKLALAVQNNMPKEYWGLVFSILDGKDESKCKLKIAKNIIKEMGECESL